MLHPQAQALIDLLVAHGLPPTHTLTPAARCRSPFSC